MENNSSESISAALKILEEAAKQKKDELKKIMSNKYKNLSSLFMENESSLKESLSTAKDHVFDAATHAKEAGVEKVSDMAREVDNGVHQSPWPFIAGSAMFGVLLGFILGRSNK
ncbi:MAG: hypothetical protein ABIL58_16645 [Pseudomonadota bacterium]